MEDVSPRRRPLALLPPAFLYLAIAVQSGFVIALPVGFVWQDKVLHLLVYAVLGLLLARGLGVGLRWAPSPTLLVLVVAGVVGLLGAADELHQALVPGRHADVLDGAADLVGGLLGALAWVGIASKRVRSWTS